MYGAQADCYKRSVLRAFENDVEMYGAQAAENLGGTGDSLRMM